MCRLMLVGGDNRARQVRYLKVHAVWRIAEVTAPIEAMLVSNGDQFAHAAAPADERRHGAEFVKRLVDVESRAEAMIAQRFVAAVGLATLEARYERVVVR